MGKAIRVLLVAGISMVVFAMQTLAVAEEQQAEPEQGKEPGRIHPKVITVSSMWEGAGKEQVLDDGVCAYKWPPDPKLFWMSGKDPAQEPQWICYDFAEPKTVDKVVVHQAGSNSLGVYEIQTWDGEAWVKQAAFEAKEFRGGTDPVVDTLTFDPISTTKIRIYITKTQAQDHVVRVMEVVVLSTKSENT